MRSLEIALGLLMIFAVVFSPIGCGGEEEEPSTSTLSPTPTPTRPSTPTLVVTPTLTPTPPPEQVPIASVHTLDTAYETDDRSLLLDFFYDWQAQVPPQSDSELTGQPPEVRAVYEVFTEFYNPFLDTEIKSSHWRPDYYKGVEFIIVQNSISFRIIHGNGTLMFIERIEDFRPELEFGEIGVVYLTDEYRQLLITFLDRDGSCQGYSGGNDRSRFLGQLAKVICEHWGGGWKIETHPLVGSIEFNPELTQASVNFALTYELLEAVYSKTDGQWAMTDIRLIAVE